MTHNYYSYKHIDFIHREFETHIMNTCSDVSTIDDVWSKHEKSFAEWLRNQVNIRFNNSVAII